MISPTSDDLIPLTGVPKIVGKISGKTPALASVYRWTSKGVSGIQLEVIQIGGRQFTTRSALDHFFMESTQARKSHGRGSGKSSAGLRLKLAESLSEKEGI